MAIETVLGTDVATVDGGATSWTSTRAIADDPQAANWAGSAASVDVAVGKAKTKGWDSNANVNHKMLVYDSNGNLIATSQETTHSYQWDTIADLEFTFSPPVPITKGEIYRLALMYDTPYSRWMGSTDVGKIDFDGTGTYASPPDPFTDSGDLTDTGDLTAWLEAETEGGPSSTVIPVKYSKGRVFQG